ncbi:MAG: ABC transporter ATP-binding protein [Chloroflexi bacterium]|nr:MAG: ABC transporter ATP-binding protein [Chloroflexota bacterium]
MNGPSPVVIQTVGLTRQYAMGGAVVHALRGVDLMVHEGEFLALMGSSGSGKSTLLNMIGLLDRPTAGRYRLEDVEVFSLSRDDLATIRGRRIGFIFQNFNLLPRYSTWENVALPLAYRKGEYRSEEQYKKAMQMLARVGLNQRAGHQPMELSGGERQRVAIARALVTEPAVLLADEPTGNLDSATGREIMALLSDLHTEGKTIIMVTHDMNIARYASRICTMRDGTLAEGEPAYVTG